MTPGDTAELLMEAELRPPPVRPPRLRPAPADPSSASTSWWSAFGAMIPMPTKIC